MRPILSFVGFAIVASIMVPRYVAQIHAGQHPATAMAAQRATPVGPAPEYSRSVVVTRSPNGHYEVEGRVDGRRLDFMVDTGASVIALTEHDAAMLGIHPAHSEYAALVKTANGTVNAAPVRLDRVEIGDLELRDVAAMVLPDTALSDNLLGMSFLSRLRRFEMSDGKLVLEQ